MTITKTNESSNKTYSDHMAYLVNNKTGKTIRSYMFWGNGAVRNGRCHWVEVASLEDGQVYRFENGNGTYTFECVSQLKGGVTERSKLTV